MSILIEFIPDIYVSKVTNLNINDLDSGAYVWLIIGWTNKVMKYIPKNEFINIVIPVTQKLNV